MSKRFGGFLQKMLAFSEYLNFMYIVHCLCQFRKLNQVLTNVRYLLILSAKSFENSLFNKEVLKFSAFYLNKIKCIKNSDMIMYIFPNVSMWNCLGLKQSNSLLFQIESKEQNIQLRSNKIFLTNQVLKRDNKKK